MSRYSEVFKSGSGWKAFFLSVATFGLAYGLYKGILDNYLAEIVAMGELGRGVTEFFRRMDMAGFGYRDPVYAFRGAGPL